MKEVTCIPHYHNQQCVTLKVTVKSKLCTPEPLVPDVRQHDRTVLLIEKNNASMRRNNQMTPWNAVSIESIIDFRNLVVRNLLFRNLSHRNLLARNLM